MKNIHILPTSKPTNLFYIKDRLQYSIFSKIRDNNEGFNIFITNDEEIKEGDWYISTHETSINQCSSFNKETLNKAYWAEKIILTTDQDLIKDGLQAIDDDFLEWFVKNPSCETVEIVKEGYKKNVMIDEATSYRYKIIIPNLEVWKDIPDFEGYYQVSNLGNVKSLSRTILGKNDAPTLLKEKMLKFSTSTNGYYQVILCKNSDRKIFKVHSLVAICFLNHIPNGTHNVVVDHINEIKTDNSVENLRLIGHRENVSRSIKDSTSTYVGVSWSKNAKKWISQITIEGKTKYLGLFDNEEDANKKYLETLKDL